MICKVNTGLMKQNSSWWWRLPGSGTALICLGILLSGCATTSQEPAVEVAVEEPQAEVQEAAPVEPPPRPRPEDYPVAPFEGDSLYQLLAAEIAGYRSHYDVALEKYMLAAEATRDPGVAARATRMALYLKDDPAALRMVDIWAAVEPDNLTAHRHAVDLLLRADRPDEAIVHMEQVKNLGGSARFEVFAYQASGLPDDKRQALLDAIEEMSSRHPEDSRLKFSRAILLQQEGKHAEALAIADAVLATEDDVNVIILKMTSLSALGRKEEAQAFLAAQVALMPANRRLRLVLARVLFEDGQLAEAQVQYEKVLEHSPNDGDVLFALALIAMQNEDDVQARRHFEKMVRWNRRSGEAHYYLGGLAERRADTQAALDHSRQAGDGYEYVPAQARIGSILVEDGLWDEARDQLQRARQEQPEKAQQLIMVEAQLLADRGLENEVFEFLDKVIADDPQNIELLYFRAMTGQRFGYLDILESDLRRIITVDPENADALNALGYTLTDQTDRHEEALELIEKALEIKPGEAAFIDSMGWVQYRLQNYDAAILHLRRALELFQNDEVAAHLGEVLWVVGEKVEAIEIWNKALEWAPESEILKSVMQRFQGE